MNKKILLWIILFLSGIFCLGASLKDKERENKMEEALMCRKDIDNDNPFGVLEFLNWNHPWNKHKYATPADLKKAVELMKEAGVGWVRMDFLWEDIEPEAGKFEFKKYDEIVDLLYENNIKILGILNYSVEWASSCGKWNCPPRDNRLFVTYAINIVKRYKNKIKYWEIWNEPDSSTYWTIQDGLKSYSILLKEVYLAIKSVDPDCKVLNGGLASGLASVNRLYDNGAKDYFDILNIHLFENPLSNPGALKAVNAYPKLAYKVMSRNGDSHKKIWITEIGCPGTRKDKETKNWWLGQNPNESEQARWLENIFRELTQDKNVERIFWAFFRDCDGHWGNGTDYFGLVRWDFSKKPVFYSYQKCFENWKKSKE